MGRVWMASVLVGLLGCGQVGEGELAAPGSPAVAGQDALPQAAAGAGSGNTDVGDAATAASASTAADASQPPRTADAGGASPAADFASAVDGSPPDAPDAQLDALGEPALRHSFETLGVEAGTEREGLCQSWTLDNDEPVWVHRVRASNEGAVHHSNWIWVPDTEYAGPDGTWPCVERGFDQIIAGAIGGVFFAQSTQSRNDEQGFPDGVAFEMPAHARIIGDIHLLNVTDAAIDTRIQFELYTLPPEEVEVALQPMAFTNLALEIPPAGKTVARMQCALPQPDLDIYYILPHFHELGLSMALDVAGGPLDGTEIWRSSASFGEPLGETFEVPLSVTGASGLGISCEYKNPRDRSVAYGFGDQEMCVTLIYSTGAKTGGTALSNLSASDSGGVHHTDGLCVSVSAP